MVSTPAKNVIPTIHDVMQELRFALIEAKTADLVLEVIR
jgi:hypothetical protein